MNSQLKRYIGRGIWARKCRASVPSLGVPLSQHCDELDYLEAL